jgi:hypothetical protein
MIHSGLATILIGCALFLDSLSYYRQIKKTLKTKKSSQISSTSFLYKIAKALCAMGGLAIYSNYVGLGMEVFMLVVYIISLIVIAKFKPKNWRLLS